MDKMRAQLTNATTIEGLKELAFLKKDCHAYPRIMCCNQLVAGGPAHSAISSEFNIQQFHSENFYAMLFSSGYNSV